MRRGCEGGGQSGKARDGSAIRKLLADVEEANDREWEVWRLGIRGNATGVAVQREWRDMSVGMENCRSFWTEDVWTYGIPDFLQNFARKLLQGSRMINVDNRQKWLPLSDLMVERGSIKRGLKSAGKGEGKEGKGRNRDISLELERSTGQTFEGGDRDISG